MDGGVFAQGEAESIRLRATAQADEIKRKQLQTILDEQQKKMQERQDKLKGNVAGGTDKSNLVGGTLGRYVQHNTQ